MKLQWPFRRDVATDTKALMFTPQNAWQFPMLPGTNIDYAGEVRNGMQSSVVTSALCWMMRTFPEAPVIVERMTEERWEKLPRHGLSELLRRPNPEYGGRVLMMATIMDFCFGEAFWLKIRNGGGDLVELWWAPRAMITPQADQKTGELDYYEYRPGNGPLIKLQSDDVVHFRFGKDPLNILRGFSPLAAIMREVYNDEQAANFTAAILRNYGVIGVIFSPKDGVIPKEAAEKLKEYVQQNFTGDKRGQAMFFTGATTAQALQYNLQGFDISPIRDIAEERVCAALALPAAVIGFGTGLQQTKVGATMREMVKLAWQGGIEPNQRIMADEMDRALLPDFQDNTSLFRTRFDTSEVDALTESPSEKTDRVLKLVKQNIIKVAQAQKELGYPVDSSQDKYARELAPAPTAGDASPTDTEPADTGATTAPAEPPTEKHVQVTNNLAPAPLNLALTMEAPRAGTKKQSGTMVRGEDGKLHIEITETIDEPIATALAAPTSNGDGSHDA